jgi:hypothetical protein
LHTLNGIMHSLRGDSTMKIVTAFCGYQFASMLAAIDAEERALPDVIKHLNAQYHQLALKLVPTALKIAEAMLDHVAQLINERVLAIQDEAGKFGLPVPSEREILRARPLLASYCRFGNQIEGVHGELLDPAGAGRARNLLNEAGMIK